MMGVLPRELLLLALVGLACFALGWWLRRAPSPRRGPKSLGQEPTSIVPLAPRQGEAAELMPRESMATLAAASQAMQERQKLPHCPACGSRMELRSFKEKRVWVCEDFPGCRGATLEE
jgi:ribosomal protein L37AE/L43A